MFNGLWSLNMEERQNHFFVFPALRKALEVFFNILLQLSGDKTLVQIMAA